MGLQVEQTYYNTYLTNIDIAHHLKFQLKFDVLFVHILYELKRPITKLELHKKEPKKLELQKNEPSKLELHKLEPITKKNFMVQGMIEKN